MQEKFIRTWYLLMETWRIHKDVTQVGSLDLRVLKPTLLTAAVWSPSHKVKKTQYLHRRSPNWRRLKNYVWYSEGAKWPLTLHITQISSSRSWLYQESFKVGTPLLDLEKKAETTFFSRSSTKENWCRSTLTLWYISLGWVNNYFENNGQDAN